jgi:ubiquinone biosynthesis accessory factor UbiK
MDHAAIQDLARRLFDSLPPTLKAARHDLEGHFRSVLQAGLARLDVTTREEFETQAKVLARTRELVEQLEARVRQLEAQLPPR